MRPNSFPLYNRNWTLLYLKFLFWDCHLFRDRHCSVSFFRYCSGFCFSSYSCYRYLFCCYFLEILTFYLVSFNFEVLYLVIYKCCFVSLNYLDLSGSFSKLSHYFFVLDSFYSEVSDSVWVRSDTKLRPYCYFLQVVSNPVSCSFCCYL